MGLQAFNEAKTRWFLLGAMVLCHTIPARAGDPPREDVILALRKALAFYDELQYHGGWASHYSTDLRQRWGEWRPTHPNVVTVEDSGTTGIGIIFLLSSQVLNETRWLHVASKTGDLLVAGQLPNGGFTQELQVTSAGVRGVHQLKPYPAEPRPAGRGVLENNATDRATELLLRLFDVTKEARYKNAADKAVNFLLAAQYPCGAFPQRYPSSNGYDKYYTLNDGATTDAILRLISYYRRTGDSRFLAAARKAGDWLLTSVLPSPAPGWAEQYDRDNRPAKARVFEPPGVGTEVTYLAVEALMELHLVTGRKEYLTPAETALAWLKTTQIQPGGRSYRLYSMATGQPIFVDRVTGVLHDDLLALPDEQRPRWYSGPFFLQRPAAPMTVAETWECLRSDGREALLAERRTRTGSLDIESGYGAFRTPAIESEADRQALAAQVDRILREQKTDGWWQGDCDGVSTIDSNAFTRNAVRLLTYLADRGVR